jgi:hypothetical protein
MRQVLGHLSTVAAMRMTSPRVPGLRLPLHLGFSSQTTSFLCQVIRDALALSFDGTRLDSGILESASTRSTGMRRLNAPVNSVQRVPHLMGDPGC